jgi:hypothetical protein
MTMYRFIFMYLEIRVRLINKVMRLLTVKKKKEKEKRHYFVLPDTFFHVVQTIQKIRNRDPLTQGQAANHMLVQPVCGIL